MNDKKLISILITIFIIVVALMVTAFLYFDNNRCANRGIDENIEVQWHPGGGCFMIAPDGTQIPYYKYRQAKQQVYLAKILEDQS